jgi:tetratricopeptide (TPR) repeat protein
LDGNLCLVLWTALRSVYQWAKPVEDESERLRLFGPETGSSERWEAACAEAPEIADAIRRIALLREMGGDVAPEVIGAACAEISRWADGRSMLEVAGHFAEAATYADPQNPAFANQAGKLCRRLRLYERSALWFRRARYAAIRTRKRAERLRALLGYGSLMRSLGRYDDARSHYLLAARMAKRTRRTKQAAEAQHDLLSIALLTGDLAQAEEHVWEALSLYPARHPHLAVLGHDWAFALVLQRFYTHAVPLIELALSRVRRPELRALMYGTLARAAAGAGRVELHQRAEAESRRLAGAFPEHAAPAYLNLAQAAWLRAQWDRAEEYARLGLAAAQMDADERYRTDATALLQSFKTREPPPVERMPPLPDVVDAVRSRYVARLSETRPPRKGDEGRSDDAR